MNFLFGCRKESGIGSRVRESGKSESKNVFIYIYILGGERNIYVYFECIYFDEVQAITVR